MDSFTVVDSWKVNGSAHYTHSEGTSKIILGNTDYSRQMGTVSVKFKALGISDMTGFCVGIAKKNADVSSNLVSTKGTYWRMCSSKAIMVNGACPRSDLPAPTRGEEIKF